MSKINYKLSTKVGADGRSQVLMRFVGSRTEMWRAKTGVWIHPDNWDGRQNCPRTTKRDQSDIAECRRVQRALDALSRFVTEKYNKDSSHGEKWLTDIVSGLKWDNAELSAATEFSEMTISASWLLMVDTDLANKVFAQSTAKSFYTIHRKLLDYERDNGSIKVKDVDAARFSDIISYMRRTYSLSDNTMVDLRIKMRRWWHWCQDRDTTLPNMPSNAGKVRGKAYGTPYYLTKEQRDAFYRTPMPDRNTENIRDVFVLQCLIGCRVSDLVTFTKANVVGDHIEYIAQKTMHSNPQTIVVPLHPIAKEIIGKYEGRCGALVPVPQHHNTYDKRLRRAISLSPIDCRITIRDCHTGMQKQVMLSEVASSHMARRTFIGCLYEQGFRESDICSMSGHKEGSISIQRYRKVSDERKRLMIDSI